MVFALFSASLFATGSSTAQDSGPERLGSEAPVTEAVGASRSAETYRAINVNGRAITLRGVAYEAGDTAPNFAAGPRSFCDRSTRLVPSARPKLASLLRCGVSATAQRGARLVMKQVPRGLYTVSMHVWENDSPQTYTVKVNGKAVARDVDSGPRGSWKLLGPFTVRARGGRLVVTTSGGAAKISTLIVTPAPDPQQPPPPQAGRAGALYRAINLNGSALTAGGIAFEAGGSAPNFTGGPSSFCNQSIALTPATDTATATMIRCSNWGKGDPGARLTMTNVPNGSYEVSLHSWEDSASQIFTLRINGQTVATNLASGGPGSWRILGPYTVSVTNGTIAINTGGGDANLSSLLVYNTATTANRPPTIVNPGNRSATVGTAITPLTISASDPDSGQVLQYSQTGLPSGLTLNAITGVVTGTPTAAGVSSVTVTATDNGAGGALSASTTFTWTVIGQSTGSLLYRAINLNGAALTAGGIAFEAGASAPNFTGGPSSFCNQSIALTPPTDTATATMIRCSNWGKGNPGARLTMTNVPSGTYEVSLHAWEDNSSQSYDVLINGQTVASTVSGIAGAWRLLGPYTVNVTTGSLAITTSGGDANLSSLIVRRVGTAVSVTNPATGAIVQLPVTVAGEATSSTGVDHVHVEILDTANGQYWNGTGWQAARTDVGGVLATPGATSTLWSYLFTPPAPSALPYGVTAVAHATGGQESAPATSTFRIGTQGAFDPTKVSDEVVAGGNWTFPVAADWLPNGNLLVLAKGGIVYDVNPATGSQTTVVNFSSRVFNVGEAGALDILIEESGTTFLVYYSAAGSDRLRISRFTIGSTVEQVVWTNPGLGYNTANPYHLGGSLNIGPSDGKLYVTIGDRVGGLSKDLTNVFGKVLRLNLDGTVPTGNPFADGAAANIDEIWATGFRNPYRSSFDPATGRFWVGDVGGNVDTQAYEEANIVEAGRAYGWPDCEGPVGPPKNGPLCPSGVAGPAFAYAHDPNGQVVQNRAIVGGEIYRATAFPLQGYYLYADYPTGIFGWVRLSDDGRTAVDSGTITTVSKRPLWLEVGPDGAIYWLDLGATGDGALHRLRYAGAANQPPSITTASASPQTGVAPLTVNFSGAATDPEGASLSYSWDFGDGTTSTSPSPQKTYTTSGVFQAQLRVTAGGDTVSSARIPITVGRPPVATITSPANGTTFNAGETITIAGSATDPDDGPLAPSALTWTVQFLHNDHSHPASTGTGSSITVQIPSSGHDFTGNTRYLVELRATDSSGISSATSITLQPNKTAVAITSNRARSMTVDGIVQLVPHTIDSLIGFQHTVSVPASECVAGTLWTFANWSDGGTRSHTITVTPNLNLAATYVNGGSCSGIGSLRYSLSNTRTNLIDLNGALVPRATTMYIVLDTTTTNFARVEFWLDTPSTAPPARIEANWPYDFAGGSVATATPFQASTLTTGAHMITVRATRSDGTSEVLIANFTVT